MGLVTVLAVSAAACSADSPPVALEFSAPPAAPKDSGPVVEVVPARETPPLDPTADPRTELGELRARYLPVWSSDFDWAFPPEVCGSDWPLDAIAEPTNEADLAVLGDAAAAAALSVMRYEHLVSQTLAEPDVLGQICIGVAAVGSARDQGLDTLASHLATGARNVGASTYPNEVMIVAAGPTAALAVACITSVSVGMDAGQDEAAEEMPEPARLGAYLLHVSRGLEDAVADISYRVSSITHWAAEDCSGLDTWAADWSREAGIWAESGEIWGPVDRTVTVDGLCESPPPDGPDECPRQWSP